jgi:hypothetical protein
VLIGESRCDSYACIGVADVTFDAAITVPSSIRFRRVLREKARE